MTTSVSELSPSDLVARAISEAQKAAKAHHDTNPHWYPCGFAWVNIKPARGKVVAHLKSIGLGRTDDYYGGYSIWNPSGHHSQHMYTLEAGARAFAEVLRAAGIKANVHTRLD